MLQFSNESAKFRFAVAFCAVLVGGTLAIADFAQAISRLPPAQREAARRNGPENSRLIFDGCVVFYGAAYATGRSIYRITGAQLPLVQLRRWSGCHMLVLNIIGATWLILPAVKLAGIHGLLRVSSAAALAMIALAVLDCRRMFTFSSKQSGGTR